MNFDANLFVQLKKKKQDRNEFRLNMNNLMLYVSGTGFQDNGLKVSENHQSIYVICV